MAASYHQFVWILCFVLGYFNTVHSEVIDVMIIKDNMFVHSGDNDTVIGYLPDLLQLVSSITGHNFSISLVPDGKYGSVDEQGDWTGMIGEVLKGNADIVGPLTVTHRRSKAIEFSYPLQSLDPAIVMVRPKEEKPPLKESLTKLLVPMEFTVWLMSVLAFLVTGTVLYIISHFNPYEWRRMAKDKEATIREAESFTCLNSFWFVISTMAWQGYVRAPRSMGGRITVTAWWFFVIIFILTYTASLTNFLRLGPAQLELAGYAKIKSMADLAKSDDIGVGFIQGGSTEAFFEHSVNEVDNKIFKKAKEANVTIGTSIEGIDYLRKKTHGDFALIFESNYARYFTNQQPCDLYMIRDTNTVTRQLALGFRLDSPLVNDVNLALLKLQEVGRLSQLGNVWFKNRCEDTILESKEDVYETPTFYQMNLGTFSGALLILACGIVFGCFVSIVEFCIYKWAETHPEDDDEVLVGQKSGNMQDLQSNEALLDEHGEPKKGGATQV